MEHIKIHTDNTKKQPDLVTRQYTKLKPPKYPHEQEMIQTIEDFEDRAWSSATMGFTTGFKGLDDAMEMLQPGFHILAGDSNMGKSSFLTAIGWNIATMNDDAYVLDFSLDDPIHDKLSRVVAYGNKVIINAVKSPNNYLQYPEMIKRRNEGIEKLREMSTSYKAYDSSHSCEIEKIEETIRMHAATIEAYGLNKRIIVIIDNFHDLSTARYENAPDKNKYDYLAQKISDMANHFDIPIICSAEFRKLNGFRRPSVDDIRELKIA